MKATKTTYWLILIIGVITLASSTYLYLKGKPFDSYFFSALTGVMFLVFGSYELKKMKRSKDNKL